MKKWISKLFRILKYHICLANDTLRGYPIYHGDTEWRYVDTNESTSENWEKRPCKLCNQFQDKDGHDPCLGELPGVMNACCGHGNPKEAYIQYENKD